MLVDHELLFSDTQAVTATAVSTNVVDLGPLSVGNTIRDIGAGEELQLFVQVIATATAAGAATLTVELISDDNAAMSSPTVVFAAAAIPVATLVAGYAPRFGVPPANYERYLALRYTIATGPLTAGTFTAGIIKGGQDTRTYRSAITTV